MCAGADSQVAMRSRTHLKPLGKSPAVKMSVEIARQAKIDHTYDCIMSFNYVSTSFRFDFGIDFDDTECPQTVKLVS
jgi:hypothetical protein